MNESIGVQTQIVVDMQSGGSKRKISVDVDLSNSHPQASEHFYDFDYHRPKEPHRMDYRLGTNLTGHQQRQFLQFWAVEVGKKADVAIDLGGAGVWMPFTISTDIIRAGATHPTYKGIYTGVHLACDASNLSMLGDNTFGGVLGNHIAEHLACKVITGNPADLSPYEKRNLGCDGTELIQTLRDHWIRILKPGGILAIIIPDDFHSDSYAMDRSHTHAYSSKTFPDLIIKAVGDLIETVEFDTFNNFFSFNWVARKR